MSEKNPVPTSSAAGEVATRTPVAPPVATAPAVGAPPDVVPPGTDAGSTAALFGGLRGGRPRKDGLKPGSPEAIQADRDKAANRMRRLRATRSGVDEPPPLPPANAGGDVPADSGGVVDGGGDTGAPPVPWQSGTLAPLVSELIELRDDLRASSRAELLREAGAPEKIVKEVEKDSRLRPAVKKTYQLTLPEILAKWANKFGISAEHSHEAALLTAVGAQFVSDRKLNAKIERLIETLKPKPAEPAPAKPAMP